jgi:hypothetical protein
MSLKTVAPYATKDLSVPIGQKIAISTNGGDNVTIWYQTNAGVSPVGWYIHDVITNEAVLLGTFSGVQGIRIETQSSPALYNIGVSPTIGVGDASTLNGYTQDATDTADTIALRDSNGDIQANAFESTVATGTAPLTVASITKVANLNADLLDNLNTATASTASTIAARDASGNLTANVLISDVAVGTAPLTVTSTTKVANLNADLLDDLNTATTSTASTVAARDASGNLTANVLISDVAIGTAPLTVTSTTKAANLNADLLDDQEGSYYLNATNISSGTLADARLSSNVVLRDGTQTITGVKTIGNDLGFRVGEAANGAIEMSYNSTLQRFSIFGMNGGYYDGSTLMYDSTVDQWQVDGYRIISANLIQDTPENGQLNQPISSNWAYDHVAAADPHTQYLLESGFTKTAIDALNINADTVDTLHASSFLRSDASDEATGVITLSSNSNYPLQITGTQDGKIDLSGASNPYINFREGSTGKANIQWHSDGYIRFVNNEDLSIFRIKDDLDFSPDNGSNYYSIWHAGNDGSGSGLDADTVDSLQATSFLRSDADDTATGIITLSSTSQYPLKVAGTNDAKILLTGSSSPYIRFQEGVDNKAYIQWNTSGWLEITNSEDDATLRIKDDLDFSLNGSDFYSIYHENNFGKTQIDALGINATSVTGAVYRAQGAQTAKTTSTTLTAAEINTGIITVNNGAAGTTTLTLPLATAMDSQFTGVAAGYSWDFSVVNISTTAAEDADVGTNTGWTLVGNMDIEADDDPRARSSAKFRARKTGTGAWTLYRMA